MSAGQLSFEDLIRANIRMGYEAELRRIKADYERTGLPLNYAEYYPAMVNSLERRIDEKMQRIAMELAGGFYNNPVSSGFGQNSCC